MTAYYNSGLLSDYNNEAGVTVGCVFRIESMPVVSGTLCSLSETSFVENARFDLFFDHTTGQLYWKIKGDDHDHEYTSAKWTIQEDDEGKDFAVACTWDGTEAQLYIQGVPKGSVTNTASSDISVDRVSIGKAGSTPEGFSIYGIAVNFEAHDASDILAWYTACQSAAAVVAELPGTDVFHYTALDNVTADEEWENRGTDTASNTTLDFTGDGSSQIHIRTSLDWGDVPADEDIDDADVSLFYITNTSGASAYRASTGAGFRGSSTSTTAVVVYLEPDFTAASGVLAGYGTVASTGHSWDFQIYSDGTKYAIRPRLRTSFGAENGAAYRIQSSDVGTILTCVATFDGTYLRTYVNGCLVGTAVITGTYTPNATQRFTILNNNLLSDPTLNTENVGIVGVLTANSALTAAQINTWHNDTVDSIDGMPPVFPGGVTVNRWIANDAYDDASVNDAVNGFLDTVGSVTVQQVVANTQAVSTTLASNYSTEIAVPAFRFTGSDNFETVNHAIGNSSTPFTINLLAHTSNAPNTGSNEGVLSYRQNGVNRGWGIRRYNSTGNIDGFAFNGSATLVAGNQYTTTSETTRNRTHLYTFSHDGTNLRLYVDGNIVTGTTACTGYTVPTSADSLIIGDTAGTNLPFLSGAIVGFSVVEGTAWQETEHDALYTSILAANDMVDDGTYAATAVWAASDNTAVGNWLDIAGGNSITKVGTPTLVYVARSRFGTES